MISNLILYYFEVDFLTELDILLNKLKYENMKNFNPADNIQDLQYFGEFGGVNPSISDSSTYTFLSAKTMFDTFEGNMEGCYLYSRHSSPSNLYLDKALAAMEGTQSANVSASGMGAITPTLSASSIFNKLLNIFEIITHGLRLIIKIEQQGSLKFRDSMDF